MKQKKTLLVVALLAGILVLGIGYAAISNVSLLISGTASATADDSNFKVAFDRTANITLTQPTHGSITANYDEPTVEGGTSTLYADIAVEDMTTQGDTATATYTIKNYSDELSATLTCGTPEVTASTSAPTESADYFKVTCAFTGAKGNAIAKQESTEVTVTVKLLKTPVSEEPAVDISVPITATPVEGQTLTD